MATESVHEPALPPALESADQPVGELALAGPQLLHAILDTAVNGIVTIDERGIIQMLNPAAARIFGYEAGELVGRKIEELMPEPHRSRHDGYIRRHIVTGERRIVGIGREVEGLRKDGTLFPMHLSVSSFMVGGQRYFAGIVADLTDRNRKAVLAATVFDHIPDGLVITDVDRKVIQCNMAFHRIFGVEEKDVVGRCSSGLYANREDFDRIRAAELAGNTDTHEPIDLVFRRFDGATFPTKTVTAAIREQDGRCVGFVCIIRDVTREVERESALHKAQRMEAYGQLTGGVAHDFNNLLTIIMGNQELLEMRLKDERDRTLLKRAQDAAEMGARLTNRLLTFARRRQLEPIVVHLNDQISGLVELLRRTIGEPIRLVCRLSPDLRTVRADPSEIENAVLNLSINARDAMSNGGELVVETSNASFGPGDEAAAGGVPPGEYVRLSVSDTGCGMTAEVLARAFEPFFTTKEPGRGTGLGLSTIYGFVKQSGGHITIYSEPGRGTTVNLYLPCADAKLSAVSRPADPGAPLAPRSETVLVVEDNHDVRDVSVARLKSLGFKVLEADSGRAAINVLRSGAKVDLVFSDIVMAGGMSGFDLARWIGGNVPGMKVLLTSGFSPEVAHAEEGSDRKLRILRKPYSRAELSEAIGEALGNT